MKQDIERINVGPRLSDVAVFNKVAYLAGQVPETTLDQGLHAQTQEVLQIIDALLARVGSDKSRILSCQIFLKDIGQIGGSGSLTHNLDEFRTGEAQAAAYAQEFSAWVRQAVRDGDMAGAMLAEGMQMTERPRRRTGSVVLAPPGAAHRNRAEHHNQHQGTVQKRRWVNNLFC